MFPKKFEKIMKYCLDQHMGTSSDWRLLHLIHPLFLILWYRDVVPTRKMWERTQKIDNSEQLQTHFKAKREKSVGTTFPRVPAQPHPW